MTSQRLVLSLRLALSSAKVKHSNLIRKARKEQSQIEAVRAALIVSEESGTSTKTPDDIINVVIERRRSSVNS